MAPKDIFLRALSSGAALGSVRRCCHGNHLAYYFGVQYETLNNIFHTQTFKNKTDLHLHRIRETYADNLSLPLFWRTYLWFGVVDRLRLLCSYRKQIACLHLNSKKNSQTPQCSCPCAPFPLSVLHIYIWKLWPDGHNDYEPHLLQKCDLKVFCSSFINYMEISCSLGPRK